MNLCLILFFVLLLLRPADSLEGARNGLLLWFHTVLPTLFPFIFVSAMLVRTGMAHRISRILSPVLTPLFRVSTDCCYAILIGLVSGYPLGAKTCSDLVENHQISREEGQYLLCFCNNASPMFIISFIGTSLLGLPYRKCVLLWGIIIVSAMLSGSIFRLFQRHGIQTSGQDPCHVPSAPDDPADNPLEYALETAIQTITKVGGYIILFGILGYILIRLPLPWPTLQAFLSGILEITTGSNALAALKLPQNIKTVLICAITAFGGLSSILQTRSVMGSSELSVTTYVHTKILHSILAATLSGILLSINIL